MNRPGFRRYWLALAPSRVTVRNIKASCIIARFELEEGDGLILPASYLRVDYNASEGGELIPMGSRATLTRRSREILTFRQKLAAQDENCALAGPPS